MNLWHLQPMLNSFCAEATTTTEKPNNENPPMFPKVLRQSRSHKDLGETLSRAATISIESLILPYLRLKTSIAEADKLASRLEDPGFNLNKEEVQSLPETLRSDIRNAGTSLVEAETYLAEASTISAASNVLTTQIQGLQDQIQQVYEIIGLGLTAEALFARDQQRNHSTRASYATVVAAP